MGDDVFDDVSEAYSFFKKCITNDKLSHAYLIEDFGNNSFNFAKELTKLFLCSNKLENFECTCQMCQLIDQEEYPELAIIEADGNFIKKEQMIELQEKFSTKPIYGKYFVCIIKDANKFNTSSANCILKFLEEPRNPIIFILLTNNKHMVINTIVSRCQIVNIDSGKSTDILEELKKYKEDVVDEDLNNILDIIYTFEDEKEKVVVRKDIYQYRDNLLLLLQVFLAFYYDILNKKFNLMPKYFDKNEKIDYICSNLAVNDIIKRIDVILSFINCANFNVNKDLYLDNFFISLAKGVCLDD